MKQYIEEQISVGTYPLGSWLPSVRDLAEQLGINRNTVSKVYQALGRDGLLEAVRGRGVRVVGVRPNGHSTEARVGQQIEALAREAQFYGLSRDWLLNRVKETSADVYRAGALRVAFVECTGFETRALSKDLSRHLSVTVKPLVLSELAADPVRSLGGLDIVSTTLFHLQEVRGIVGSHKVELVGINHAVAHESALDIARLQPGSIIAVVCPNERTLERVRKIVESFARGEIRSCTVEDREALRRALHGADVVVDTSMTHDAVMKERLKARTITVRFHIERQSIEYLQDVVRRHATAPAS